MNIAPLVRSLTELDRHPPHVNSSPERDAAFAGIAQFLESQIRSGQPFDLKTVHPNPLWLLFEDRLQAALTRWTAKSAPPDHVRIHQWYNSGVVWEADGLRLGFDLVPMRRLYQWEDRHDLTGQLADWLDVLLITHRHEDHYDADLVRACLERDKPVYMPAALARTWKPAAGLVAVADGDQWSIGAWTLHAQTGIHIWRETPEQVPLIIYTAISPAGGAWVYGGDVDYTQMPAPPDPAPVQAFFVPWRSPNARHEDGDARQEGTLLDALHRLIDQWKPAMLFYEHCAELEHVYDGFPASFDMALESKHRLAVASELMFWGEWMDRPARCDACG